VEYTSLRDQLRNAYEGRRVSEQTVRSLLKRFRENGLDGLEHAINGQSRTLTVDFVPVQRNSTRRRADMLINMIVRPFG
jgi:hypothetical protein